MAARVEAPCLGKNISSATNALVCANMAVAGYEYLIPLDEVIGAMGGLSITPSAKKLEKRLKR